MPRIIINDSSYTPEVSMNYNRCFSRIEDPSISYALKNDYAPSFSVVEKPAPKQECAKPEHRLVKRNTIEGWSNQLSYVPQDGEVCIYEDCLDGLDEYGEKKYKERAKIGDGNAYLVDLPFLSDDEFKNLVL